MATRAVRRTKSDQPRHIPTDVPGLENKKKPRSQAGLFVECRKAPTEHLMTQAHPMADHYLEAYVRSLPSVIRTCSLRFVKIHRHLQARGRQSISGSSDFLRNASLYFEQSPKG